MDKVVVIILKPEYLVHLYNSDDYRKLHSFICVQIKEKKGCGSSNKELPYHIITDTATAILTAFTSTDCVFAGVSAYQVLAFLV
jgi:hypothetical protein